MLASVLGSRRAVEASIQITRVFVRLREFLSSHQELAGRAERVEATQAEHASIIYAPVDEI